MAQRDTGQVSWLRAGVLETLGQGGYQPGPLLGTEEDGRMGPVGRYSEAVR